MVILTFRAPTGRLIHFSLGPEKKFAKVKKLIGQEVNYPANMISFFYGSCQVNDDLCIGDLNVLPNTFIELHFTKISTSPTRPAPIPIEPPNNQENVEKLTKLGYDKEIVTSTLRETNFKFEPAKEIISFKQPMIRVQTDSFQIKIKTQKGDSTFVSVVPTQSIGELINNIPSDFDPYDHVGQLTIPGIFLSGPRTLGYYSILPGQKLFMRTREKRALYQCSQITVFKSPTEKKEIKFPAKDDFTILELKQLIAKEFEDLPAEQQRLILQGDILDDIDLVSQKIPNNSITYVENRIPKTIDVVFKTTSYGKVSVAATKDSTIADVKQLLQKRIGTDGFDIYHDYIKCEEKASIKKYHTSNSVVVSFSLFYYQGIKVELSDIGKEKECFGLDPTSRVIDLKCAIRSQFNIPVAVQTLQFEDEKLDNYLFLEDLNYTDGEIVLKVQDDENEKFNIDFVIDSTQTTSYTVSSHYLVDDLKSLIIKDNPEYTMSQFSIEKLPIVLDNNQTVFECRFHNDTELLLRPEPQLINVVVRTPDSDLNLSIDLEDTVLSLKYQIMNQNSLYDIQSQKLICNARPLEEHKRLGDYEIKEGDLIQMFIRISS